MWTCALWLLAALAAVHTKPPCAPRHSSMGITVLSRRNETGHWTAQLNFTHDSDAEHLRDSGPWRVDFNQSTTVCELGEAVLIVATLTSVPLASGGPREGRRGEALEYVPVEGVGRYRLHVTASTWDDARQKCVDEGGHLAIINSAEEAKALLAIWQKTTRLNNYFVFLGFHDLNGEGRYVTVNGEPLEATGYNDWEKGQPDDSRGENCGGFNRSGKLHDLSCTTKIPYFCEKSPPL